MTLNESQYMSNKDEWETPQPVFDKLDGEFHFTLDPCASDENKKCDKYFTKEIDGLIQSWSDDTVYMNPPYGKELAKWVRKAFEESQNGTVVVCLIPSRTDTRFWHEFVMRAREIRFVTPRLSFVGSDNKAPFPASVVVFDPSYTGSPIARSWTWR